MEFLDLFGIQEEATRLIGVMGDLHVDPPLGERRGGYLTLAGIDGLPFNTIVLPVGEILSSLKGSIYMSNSLEKATRLKNHFDRDPSVVSSWQTRDVDSGMYGGAVLATPRGGIVSFSGLPEHYDETLCVGVTHYLRLENRARTDKITRISDNKILLHLNEHGFG